MMTKINNVCCCNDLFLFFKYPAYNRKILMFTIKLIELKINGIPKKPQ